jgi:hypothetical protein
MNCPRCQHENPPQAKFCLECGIALVLKCTVCGTEIPAGAKFCLECGQSVGAQPAIASRFTSPGDYSRKITSRDQGARRLSGGVNHEN